MTDGWRERLKVLPVPMDDSYKRGLYRSLGTTLCTVTSSRNDRRGGSGVQLLSMSPNPTRPRGRPVLSRQGVIYVE